MSSSLKSEDRYYNDKKKVLNRGRDRDRDRDDSRNRSTSRDRERGRDRSNSRDRKYKSRDRSDSREKKSKKGSKRRIEDSDSERSSDSDSDSDYKQKKKYRKEKKRLKREQEEKEERDRKEKREKEDDGRIGGYSNELNPFGDSKLTSKFEWKAKKEKFVKSGQMSSSEYEEKYGRKNKEDVQMEIEKAKKRREDRDREQEQWEQEKDRLSRMKDMENYEELEKKEEEFHYLQACRRSETRLVNGRPKPIDFLYRVLHMDTQLNYEHIEPVNLIKSLSKQQLEEIINEISEFVYLDHSHYDYWLACQSFTENELLLKSQTDNNNVNNANISSSVLNDIKKLLQGKYYNELCKLELDINNKLQSGKAMNVEYWETLLDQLKSFKSLSLIRETFLTNLKIKLSNIENAQQLIKNILETDINPNLINNSNNTNSNNNNDDSKNIVGIENTNNESKDPNNLDDNEEQFDMEVPLESKFYSWHDKFRPRKPKYFNRVHSGYDWNKYNKTHYDFDNPPPKIVKGYKFNIFYPDLIDKTKAPTYYAESTGDPDTQIVRFHAGPPYEDIAFKIVNREWEKSIRYGYKCVFERGILYLWFNFKRYKYKR